MHQGARKRTELKNSFEPTVQGRYLGCSEASLLPNCCQTENER